MADVVLSTVDLDVFGGPSSVNVSLDIGDTGQRGSRIWSGPNGFNIDLVGQDIKLFDIYINTTTSQMFQYTQQLGSPAWIFLQTLSINELTTKVTTFFTNGASTISYNLIPPGAVLNDYTVTYSIADGFFPIATSHFLTLSGGVLFIYILASSLNGSTWSNVTGNRIVHLKIAYKKVA